MGMEYNYIYECPNDCILFGHKHEHLQEYHSFGTDRYREDVQGESVPTKFMRPSSITSHIKTIFKCKTFLELMAWHCNASRYVDGVMSAPRDSQVPLEREHSYFICMFV